MNKKGQIDALQAGVLALVFVGITAAIGLQVMGQTKATFDADSLPYNATVQAETGISNTTVWYAIIGTLLGASVILGLIAVFGRRAA